MRLATWNVLSGMSLTDGFVGAARLRAAAADLDVDVLAVQEVDRGQPRSHGVDLTNELASGLGAAHHRFAAALVGTPGGTWRGVGEGADGPGADDPQYGVALVSRRPVRSWHVLRLPAAPVRSPILLPGTRRVIWLRDEPRVALAAVLEVPVSVVPAGVMTVVSTHLSFVPGWNVRQLRTVVGQLRHLPGPHVVLGDLNLPAVLAARVRGLSLLARQPTYPAARPRFQLDHVLAGPGLPPVAVTGARSLDFSDHRALVVDLGG